MEYMPVSTELKDMFGKPNEGIHSYRVFGFAVFDFLMTLVAAKLIQKYYFKDETDDMTMFIKIFVALFLLGIIIHRMLGVKTALNNQLF